MVELQTITVLSLFASFALGFETRNIIRNIKKAWSDATEKAQAKIKPLRWDG